MTAGLAAGMVLSLIWMVLLRFCAGIMAWAVVLTVNILCAACTILAFLKVYNKRLPATLQRAVIASVLS